MNITNIAILIIAVVAFIVLWKHLHRIPEKKQTLREVRNKRKEVFATQAQINYLSRAINVFLRSRKLKQREL